MIKNNIKSSSAAEIAELAASLDRLRPHGSVQVSTIASHHQLQNWLPCRNRSDEAASSAADDGLLKNNMLYTQKTLNKFQIMD